VEIEKYDLMELRNKRKKEEIEKKIKVKPKEKEKIKDDQKKVKRRKKEIKDVVFEGLEDEEAQFFQIVSEVRI